MLKKSNRLTKDKDFTNVFKKGKSSYDKIIGLKVAKNLKNNTRFGIVVSTKISKKAVERNKIKRQIRAILHKNFNFNENTKDIVIITLPEIKTKNFTEISESLISHLKKLKLLK